MGHLLDAIDRRGDLMGRMLERLDIDVAASAAIARGTILASAARRCFFCRSARTCQAWFETGAQGDGHRLFCPNADRFAVLPRLPQGGS